MLKPTSCGPKHIATTMLLALLLALTIPDRSYSGESATSGSVVELTVAEADSVIQLIDELTLDLRLSRIDLAEAGALASVDSSLAAQRLDLTVRSYEVMLQAYKDERDNWVQRLVKQPMLWFVLGAWIGVQAE